MEGCSFQPPQSQLAGDWGSVLCRLAEKKPLMGGRPGDGDRSGNDSSRVVWPRSPLLSVWVIPDLREWGRVLSRAELTLPRDSWLG